MAKQIKLRIEGVGNIKSLKNNKLMVWKTKRMITDPKSWKQQKLMVNQLEEQLLKFVLDSGIEDDTTLMALREQFSTASSELVADWLTFLPKDDSYMDMPEIHIYGELVKKGEEFVEITVTEP